ncbi:MAG TPA: GSU2403 family nucleotidyltransferase fold protein [Thermoanaerobaculia bacterium]|nr:GSU2403 family nucleotidyltransferase fold protein [Thermoanaerobaculia bacterium]
MTITRVAETTQTVYSELLDQLRSATVVPRSGSFVSKSIAGSTYWYVQRKDGARRRQIYLGPESPELLATIARAEEARDELADEESRRRELVAMLIAGGMAREHASIAGVLTTIADAGLFRAGAVLVGTHAFICIANMMGVRFDHQTLRTADVDLPEPAISVGVGAIRVDILETLRASDPRFVAVPELDPRNPSTSFKVRGRDLRLNLLTPGSRDGAKPVHLPQLNAAAQPLPGLEYLLAESTEAAVLAGAGILVQIPTPAAFALHKLWVAERRPVSEQQKARKDRRQAAQLIEVLAEDRPLDLRRAWQRLPANMVSSIRRSSRAMDGEARQALEDTAVRRA